MIILIQCQLTLHPFYCNQFIVFLLYEFQITNYEKTPFCLSCTIEEYTEMKVLNLTRMRMQGELNVAQSILISEILCLKILRNSR